MAASTGISAEEQLMMELMNRARLDPAGEAARLGVGLNDGYAPGTFSAKPLQPLAWDLDFAEVAALHADWLAAGAWETRPITDVTGPNGSSPFQRAYDAGWRFQQGDAPLYYQTHGGMSGGQIPEQGYAEYFYLTAFRNTLREGILDASNRTVGLGIEYNADNTRAIWSHYTSDSPQKTYVTGVAYSDRDRDGFYDQGEGLGGVKFDRVADNKGAATSMTAGGYSLQTAPSFAGWTTMEVTHGSSEMRVEIELARGNAKLDYLGSATFAASVDLTLGQGAKNGLLLGAGALELKGNGGANTLDGGTGANRIWGLGANDTVHGLDGNDQIWGGDGNDSIWGDRGNDKLYGDKGSDTLWGGAGNDSLDGGVGADVFIFADTATSTIGRDTLRYASDDKIRIDLAGALPNEAKWENTHIDKVKDGFQIEIGDGGTIHVITTASLTQLESDLVLF